MAQAGERYEGRTGNIWSYAYRGDLTGLKASIQYRGVDPNLTNTVGWTACHAAAAGGQTKALRYLVKNCGASLEINDLGGGLPVHQAAKNGHVNTLLAMEREMGADLSQIRLSQAKGKAVKDLVRKAYNHNKCRSKDEDSKLRRNTKGISIERKDEKDKDDDDAAYTQQQQQQILEGEEASLQTDHIVGYSRKQSKSTAFWGPRKTPISGKIKKKILKKRRQRYKDKRVQYPSTNDSDNEEEVVEGGAKADEQEEIGYAATVQEVKRARKRPKPKGKNGTTRFPHPRLIAQQQQEEEEDILLLGGFREEEVDGSGASSGTSNDGVTSNSSSDSEEPMMTGRFSALDILDDDDDDDSSTAEDSESIS